MDRSEYNFDDPIRVAAWSRQNQKCAACEGALPRFGFIGHHVVPVQSLDYASAHGSTFRQVVEFMTSEDNCVAVCKDCHYHYHECGRNDGGAVADAQVFKFSHGVRTDLHREWKKVIALNWRLLFPSVEQEK
jgi:hypothetical protein